MSKHEVFAELEAAELIYLERILDYEEFEIGETIFAVGSMPSFLYYIAEGRLNLQFPNNQKLSLEPGQLIGELGLLNGDFRLGTLTALEKTKVYRLCGTRLFEEQFVPARTALKIIKHLGRRMINYFRSQQQVSSLEIIRAGESDNVEFKSTLRWNIYTNKKDKAIELAILKTMAAFMNTEGGMLFVGVADDGSIVGLETDQFPNHDKLLLHFTHLVKDRIGSLFLQYLHTSIEPIDGKEFLRIDCLPAPHPAYVIDDHDDYFYIRTGPATTKLKSSKIHPYIKDRFESN